MALLTPSHPGVASRRLAIRSRVPRGRKRICHLLALLVWANGLMVLATPSANAAPGDIEWFRSTQTSAEAVTVDQQDRVLVAGWQGGFAVSRFAQQGDVDTSFGSGGTVAFADLNLAQAIQVLPDGRVVAAGAADYAFNVVVVMLLDDGSPDPSFGSGGLVRPDFGDYSTVRAVTVDDRGNILIAGTLGFSDLADFYVARFRPDGSRDGSFGVDGVARTDVGGLSHDTGESIAITNDGRVLVAGTTKSYLEGDDDDFAAVRYTENGLLDPTFGVAGRVVTETGDSDGVSDMVLLPNDGAFVLAGGPRPDWFGWSGQTGARLVLARYRSDGSLDEGFGSAGFTSLSFPSWLDSEGSEIARDDEGRLVAVTRGTAMSGDILYNRTDVNRFNSAGTLDETFSGGFGWGGGTDVALQSSKGIVVAGRENGGGGFLARLQGKPDAVTTVTVEAPARAQYGDAVIVRGVLSSGGRPLQGRQVTVSFAGHAVSVVTDGTGAASASFTAPPPGAYGAAVSFAGSRGYLPSNGTSSVTVEQEATSVRYTGQTSARGSTVQVAAALTEDDGLALAGASLEFDIAGKTYRATTDLSGHAEATAKVEDHGRSTPVTVRFTGTATHLPSSASATVTWGG